MTVQVVVPVYNSEQHILTFLQSLTKELMQIDVRFRVTLVNDCSSDETLPILEAFVESSKEVHVQVINLEQRVGQQMAIWFGIKASKENEMLLIVDDDMAISAALLRELINPVLSGANDLVVAQQSARGIRRFTSGAYWYAHQKFSGSQFEGRDLMLRSVSSAIVEKIASSTSGLQSVSETTEKISINPARIKSSGVEFFRAKSRYSSFDRFKLFVDLILVRRKAIGYIIMLLGLAMITMSSIMTLLASVLGLISINSPGTLLALIVFFIGSINLVVIGLVQVSLASLLESKGE